jgi:hypothetical protein
MHNYIWCPYYLPSFMKFCSVVSEGLRWQTVWRTDGQDKNNMSPHQSGGRHNNSSSHIVLGQCFLAAWTLGIPSDMNIKRQNFKIRYLPYVGTLWDFKNCVTDNLFWAKLLYSGVFVKEIIHKLFLNHFIGKLSNSSILGVKFKFCQILSFQTNFLPLMYQE